MAESAQKTSTKRSPRSGLRPPAVRRSIQSAFRPRVELAPSRTTLLQPVLKVGSANDPLEKEAEATAETIVSMPSPDMAVSAVKNPSSGTGQDGSAQARRTSIDDQPDLDTLESAPPIPADHVDPDIPQEENVDTTELASDDMGEIESGVPQDTGGDPPAAETPVPADEPVEGEPEAQPERSGDAAVVGTAGGAAPTDVA